MGPIRSFLAAAVLVAICGGCDTERAQECSRMLAAMKPLDDGTPTADTVDRVRKEVSALKLQDQPLHIYAQNYENTLTVLSNTLRLEASPSAPDGTDDVVKSRLNEARTDRVDAARYCSE